MTLRLVYLIQQFPPEIGAGPARASEMLDRWLRADVEATVLTAMPNRPVGRIFPEYRGRFLQRERQGRLEVLRTWLHASPRHGFLHTLLNNLSFMLTALVAGLWRLRRSDVLIASSPPFFPHIAGVALAWWCRAALVLEVRDLWPDYLVGLGTVRGIAAKALFALERWLLRRAALIVVVTESFRQRVIEKGIPGERIIVIPNGVDTERYFPEASPEPPIPALVRQPGEFLVGYLGNMGLGQHLVTVLDAAERVKAAGFRVRFVLAGDGPERAMLERELAGRVGLPVTLHPPIPKSSTRAFYNCCDAVLVPLTPVAIFQETVPSKLFEALACARPVIASLGGEGASILQKSGGGIVTPPGDAQALAEAIFEVHRMDPEERAAMGARGLQHVRQHFSRTGLADTYLRSMQALHQSRGA
jgi:colanic acid biosynthesis glycosyl transferase WcaI